MDDEVSILTFAERALSDAGYEVVVAADGPEALRLVEAKHRPFDLFVLDVLEAVSLLAFGHTNGPTAGRTSAA